MDAPGSMIQNEIGVPIFTYHSLDSSGSVISTSSEQFRRQMEDLSKSDHQVLSLSEVAKCIRERRSLPSRSAVITFDDGFANLYDVALPILKEFQFPATVFLVTEFCGKNNQWYGQPASIPALELLNWNQISEMAAFHFEFGVHTATHPDFTKTPFARLEEEILGARETIKGKLGKNEMAFAYPYGKRTDAAEALVQNGFYAACSTEMDFTTRDSNRYFLPRIDMYYFSRNNRFSSIGTPAFQRFVHLRKTLRGLKQAVAGG
jgi:peptidoglycan/xylan/chitin deacetylase (PgdA/CDA1 family)